MRFHHVLVAVGSFFSLVHAATRKVTVDDASNEIEYLGTWNIGNECTGCSARPDENQAREGTWHDGTATSDRGPKGFTFTFTGVSIEIYLIYSDMAGRGFTVDTNFDVLIDNKESGTFSRQALANNVFTYDNMAYRQDGLANETHTVVVNLNEPSVMLLDYLQYEVEEPEVPTSSSSSSTVSSSSTSSATNSTTGGTNNSNSNNDKNSDNSSVVGPAIGGVLAGLALIVGLVFLWWYRKRYLPAKHMQNLEARPRLDLNQPPAMTSLMGPGSMMSPNSMGYAGHPGYYPASAPVNAMAPYGYPASIAPTHTVADSTVLSNSTAPYGTTYNTGSGAVATTEWSSRQDPAELIGRGLMTSDYAQSTAPSSSPPASSVGLPAVNTAGIGSANGRPRPALSVVSPQPDPRRSSTYKPPLPPANAPYQAGGSSAPPSSFYAAQPSMPQGNHSHIPLPPIPQATNAEYAANIQRSNTAMTAMTAMTAPPPYSPGQDGTRPSEKRAQQFSGAPY